ncbi:MAG TPA: type III secretion system inner membrane ring subunit SctD [Herbaspirillum sp.]|jgi:type III secretion system YscD/HrpQ family protein
MQSFFSESPTIELRILSGPQTGAALPLADQDILLGSDRECDVVLQGAGIMARHASLSIGANGFTLTALDGDVTTSVDAATPAPWQLGATVYLGEIGVTVDRCSEAWHAAAPPRLRPHDHLPPANTGRWLVNARQHWKRLALLLTVLTTIAAGVQIMTGTHGASGAQGPLSPTNIRDINRIVARYGSDYGSDTALKLEKTPKGLRVHGFLPNAGRVNALRGELSKWRPALLVDVKAEDALLAASRHFLGRQRSTLKVSVVEGHAELSGLAEGMEAQEDVKRLAQDLQKNVPGLASVKATFVDKPRLEAWLRTWHKKDPPIGRQDETVLVDAMPNGVLALNGTLPPLRLERLRQALMQHSRRQNMLLAMRIAITPDRSGDQPPLVRAFSQGAVPYVFLSNGRRLMIGGHFEGFQLVAVKGQGPVFEKKGG